MKWDKVSGKNTSHKNHPCLSQYRPYKVNPMHTPGRADPCSDTRRALRLYFPSRVLPQQVPPWSQASIISTPHSTSQHIPASLKSSQTPTLQMFLHYQEFLSILTLQAPTSQRLLYIHQHPLRHLQKMIKGADYSMSLQVYLHPSTNWDQ